MFPCRMLFWSGDEELDMLRLKVQLLSPFGQDFFFPREQFFVQGTNTEKMFLKNVIHCAKTHWKACQYMDVISDLVWQHARNSGIGS